MSSDHPHCHYSVTYYKEIFFPIILSFKCKVFYSRACYMLENMVSREGAKQIRSCKSSQPAWT